MRELEFRDFARILPLVPHYRDAGHMTFVHAVIEGSMPGTVFVDDPAAPGAAFVASWSGFDFALGRPGANFARQAIPRLAEAGAAEPGTVWATTDGWSAVLEPLFRTRRQRDEFLPPLTAPAAAPPAAGLEISTDLDRIAVSYSVALARESPGEPQSPWLLDVWGGPDGFARGSFGVGVFRDGQLAGLCAACAVAGATQPPEAEIEIWTAERERRTGLASMSGALFISECHARGMLAAWTCESSNHPSRRLAARLGFRFLRRIDGFPLADRLI